MEFVLLLLDELDDALFTLALEWERVRQLVLGVGLAASLALAAAEVSALAAEWAPALFGIAVASVGAWGLGAVLRAYYRREAERLSSVA